MFEAPGIAQALFHNSDEVAILSEGNAIAMWIRGFLCRQLLDLTSY
jgi:hypothetical protein